MRGLEEEKEVDCGLQGGFPRGGGLLHQALKDGENLKESRNRSQESRAMMLCENSGDQDGHGARW